MCRVGTLAETKVDRAIRLATYYFQRLLGWWTCLIKLKMCFNNL